MNFEGPSSANTVAPSSTSGAGQCQAPSGRASPRASDGYDSYTYGDAASSGSRPTTGTPSFTGGGDDDKKELATLSITDTIQMQNDLHGAMANHSQAAAAALLAQKPISGGSHFTTTTSGTNSSTASNHDNVSTTIARLDGEISALPPSETAAYRRAQEQCPDQLGDKRKMAFVEYEDGNLADAARKLVQYWDERLYAFGPDRAFLPMTLAGAMQDEVLGWVQHPIWQLLPRTDTAGRAVLYAQTSLRDFAKHTPEQELRSFFYLLETLLEDDDRRRMGFVVLYDARNIQRQHFSRSLTSKLTSLAERVFPLSCCAVHNCHPSRIFNHVVLPVMKAVLTKDLRLRIKSHVGTTADLLRDLEGYCLTREVLPSSLGGEIVPDLSNWVLDRIQLENSRLALQLSGMALSQDLPTMLAPAPAKRLRSDNTGGQQQQQYQQQQLPGMQLPGMQQPFPYPLQLSGMQQQLPTQFAAAANAPSMQYAPGSTNINSTGSASSKSSSKKKGGKTGRRRGPPRGKYVDPRVSICLLYTSPSPRDVEESRMPSSA